MTEVNNGNGGEQAGLRVIPAGMTLVDSPKKVGLERLIEPFSANQIGKLPKPYSKDSPKGSCKECGGYHGLPALHLDYVGHAALTARLLEADINWNWEPLAMQASGLPLLDQEGGLWIKLTVSGQTRLGYGEATGKTGGDAMKIKIGDALRNAAMRFGAGLDMWHKGDLYEQEQATVEEKKKEEFESAPMSEQEIQTFRSIYDRVVKVTQKIGLSQIYQEFGTLIDTEFPLADGTLTTLRFQMNVQAQQIDDAQKENDDA